jgi:hypothetical protein
MAITRNVTERFVNPLTQKKHENFYRVRDGKIERFMIYSSTEAPAVAVVTKTLGCRSNLAV